METKLPNKQKVVLGVILVTTVSALGIMFMPNAGAVQSGLTELEASHKAQVEILNKTKESLCSTEVAIAKEKVRLHIEGKQTFDNYDLLTQKAIGQALDCSKL